MARTPHKQRPPRTKLAAWRLKRGASQDDMVRDTGIPLSTYQRMEAGEKKPQPYQRLYNCAIVLEVEVDDLIEDKFKSWTVFHSEAAEPPVMPRWRARDQQPK